MSLERQKKIVYKTPAQTMEEEDRSPQHTFDLIVDGEKIGGAEVDYFSKPIPLYQLTDLYVDFEQKGNTYASQLMEQVEAFLREKKKPGVLVEAIIEGDKAVGMYERRGWQKVSSENLYVFNWPEDVPLTVLTGYPFRYTDLTERPSHRQMP